MRFLRQTAAVAAKDLRLELRGRHAVGVVLPFAGTLLITLGLALGPGRALLEEAAPAALWLAVLFAAVLSVRAAYEAEGEDGALESVLLAPVDRAAVFAGKVLAVVLQLSVLQATVALLVVGLFGVSLGMGPSTLAAFGLGTVGLAAVGSLFGVLTESARAREAILPLLVLPLAVPVLIAATRTMALAQAGHGGEAASWLALLLVFDLVFLSAGSLLFGYLLED